MQRFWNKVEVRGPDECWPWTAGLHRGYGEFKLPNGKSGGVKEQAQRTAWRLTNGPIPKGYDVDHLCDNPLCCNPKHLDAVTHSENMKRMWAKRKARLGALAGMNCGKKLNRRWWKRPIRAPSP